MSDGPLVGVVVPAQNRGDLLRECLESIQAQTYERFECIVADDASEDDVPEVAQSFAARDPRFRHLRLERGGAQRARNAGWQATAAEFLVFQDSDDLFAPRKLEASVEAFAVHPEADMVVGQTDVFEAEPGDLGFLWNAFEPADHLRRFLRRDVVWPCQGAVWRRSFLDKVGPWREALTSNQDFDQNLRGLLAGACVHLLDEVLVHVRLAGPSVSRGESPERKRQRLRDMEAVYAYAQGALTLDGRLRDYGREVASQAMFLARESAALGDQAAMQTVARLHSLDAFRASVAAVEVGLILRTGRFAQTFGRLNQRLGLELPQVQWMRTHRAP